MPVTPVGVVNLRAEGTYQIVYEATDSQGLTTTAIRVLTVLPNEQPVIRGADAVAVPAGEVFDLRAGVTVTDSEEGDITANLELLAGFDEALLENFSPAAPGLYVVTYVASDSDGGVTQLKREITVEVPPAGEQPAPPAGNDAPDTDGTMDLSQAVVYLRGKLFAAGFEEPAFFIESGGPARVVTPSEGTRFSMDELDGALASLRNERPSEFWLDLSYPRTTSLSGWATPCTGAFPEADSGRRGGRLSPRWGGRSVRRMLAPPCRPGRGVAGDEGRTRASR